MNEPVVLKLVVRREGMGGMIEPVVFELVLRREGMNDLGSVGQENK